MDGIIKKKFIIKIFSGEKGMRIMHVEKATSSPKQGRSVVPERVKFITGLCSKYYFVSKHRKQGRRIGSRV